MSISLGPETVALRECDLVLKGGITSGVVYPRLISALSKVYTFRNVGGTSAGAIAAAAAAAAQLGVIAGTNSGAFDRLDALPDELSFRNEGTNRSTLFGFFQPRPALRRHFAVLSASLNACSIWSRIRRANLACLHQFPLGAVLGAMPGVILLVQSWWMGSLLSLVLIAVGAAAGAAVAMLRSLVRNLPPNHFGLCNGMPTESGLGPEALTPWLHRYLNDLAGKTSGDPLTFGELRSGAVAGSGAASRSDGASRRDEPAINLEMMTTALNLRRPYRLPFEETRIYFVASELAPFFPDQVLAWLVTHARPSETARELSTPERTYLALPIGDDLPVVVAVRLSLSFPILLSAVPLYLVDRTLKVNSGPATRAVRVYFSDGGISSNFPVHFFDSPLPARPTFGVNLRGFHPDHSNDRVFLPKMLRNNEGVKTFVPKLCDEPGLSSVVQFLATILDTMQSWRDHLQLGMPGFRDRIVHVSYDAKKEGGLNLDMPPAVVETLARSGAEAASKLIEVFAMGGGPANPNGWDNHRRIRARTLLALLQEQIGRIDRALDVAGGPTYADVVQDPKPPSYPFGSARAIDDAMAVLEAIRSLTSTLTARKADLSCGAPNPRPELRAVPRT